MKQSSVKWRFVLGLALFILGWTTPLFIPFVLLLDVSDEVKVALSTALTIGVPEVLWALAVIALGKRGFNTVKKVCFRLFKKHALPAKVGRRRYTVGLVLFISPLILGWFGMYLPGLIPGFDEHHLLYTLIGNGIFLSSLFVLGGEFWEKFKALFIYDAIAQNRKDRPP